MCVQCLSMKRVATQWVSTEPHAVLQWESALSASDKLENNLRWPVYLYLSIMQGPASNPQHICMFWKALVLESSWFGGRSGEPASGHHYDTEYPCNLVSS